MVFFFSVKVSSRDGGKMSLFGFSGSDVGLDKTALVSPSIPGAG